MPLNLNPQSWQDIANSAWKTVLGLDVDGHMSGALIKEISRDGEGPLLRCLQDIDANFDAVYSWADDSVHQWLSHRALPLLTLLAHHKAESGRYAYDAWTYYKALSSILMHHFEKSAASGQSNETLRKKLAELGIDHPVEIHLAPAMRLANLWMSQGDSLVDDAIALYAKIANIGYEMIKGGESFTRGSEDDIFVPAAAVALGHFYLNRAENEARTGLTQSDSRGSNVRKSIAYFKFSLEIMCTEALGEWLYNNNIADPILLAPFDIEDWPFLAQDELNEKSVWHASDEDWDYGVWRNNALMQRLIAVAPDDMKIELGK
ncbi:TPA: hypothetical protein QDB23_001679 [Burkholderia vietnamiensis]|nr:hypothetical protein [Burkholderia vietnamiensis]